MGRLPATRPKMTCGGSWTNAACPAAGLCSTVRRVDLKPCRRDRRGRFEVRGWRLEVEMEIVDGHAAITMPIAERREAGCTRGVSPARWAVVRGLGADAERCWLHRGRFGRVKAGKGLTTGIRGLERTPAFPRPPPWRRSGASDRGVISSPWTWRQRRRVPGR